MGRRMGVAMDGAMAAHILGSRTVAEMRDLSGLGHPEAPGASKEQLAKHAKAMEAGLAGAQRALGVKVVDDEGLRLAKGRLLTAMEQAADLVGLGDGAGSILRGADFHGAAGEGRLTAEAARELLNPERPDAAGARWTLSTGPGGKLAARSSKARVSPEGLVAVDAKRVAQKMAGRLGDALGGFDGVWEALGECADNERRLGSLGGADCWSKQEVGMRMEESLAKRLTPLGPGSEGFPAALDEVAMGERLAARRAGATPAPGPKAGQAAPG